MIPYLILIFIPIFFAYVAIFNDKGRLCFALGQELIIRKSNLHIQIFFIIFFILLSIRHFSVGVDVYGYNRHFLEISKLDFTKVLVRSGDILYNLLNWLVSRFTTDFRVYIIIVSAMTLLPISVFFSDDREYSTLKLLIFINMPTFIMIFSGLRQALAFSVGLIAYKFVREKKLIHFLVSALVAVGFHHSAFIIFVFYPLYHITFKKKHLWFVIPSMLLVYIFNRPIFNTATAILNYIFGEDYSAVATDTGAYTMLILYILFAIFSYVIPDESLMNKETLGLRNFLLMAVAIQCFAPLHTLAMRMNYYFILFIPMLIPKIIKCSKQSLKQVAFLSNWVLSGYLLVYYLDKLYTSCTTGVSSLGTYPYRFFWQ